MKKHILISASLAIVLCAGCSKDRNCRCTTTEAAEPQETIINTDHGMKCAKITRLGFERQVEGHLVRTYEAVSCENANE